MSLSWEATEGNEAAPQPPFLQTGQTQSPQPPLTGHGVQPFLPPALLPCSGGIQGPSQPSEMVGPSPAPSTQGEAALTLNTMQLLSLLPTSSSRSCSGGQLSSCSSPSLYLCLALLHPRCRIWHSFLNFMPLMIAQCSSLPLSLCKASCHVQENENQAFGSSFLIYVP